MKTEIRTFAHENGAIQKVQVVKLDCWEELSFFTPAYSQEAFERFCDIYREQLLPKFPYLFSEIVMFCLSEDVDLPETWYDRKYGTITDRNIMANLILREGVSFKNGQPSFKLFAAEKLWQQLEKNNCVQVLKGKGRYKQVITVSRNIGMLSTDKESSPVRFNTSFFLFDPIDVFNPYDVMGEPYGLLVSNGSIERTPLYDRDCLLVDENNNVEIKKIGLKDLTIEINGISYKPGEDVIIYERPRYGKAPETSGKQYAVSGNRIIAIKDGGETTVPLAGFVMEFKEEPDLKGNERVNYKGLENIKFGIQCANAAVKEGKIVTEFTSAFYNLKKLNRVPYPPCTYPMNYRKDRAARMVIGADKENKPMVIWLEGAGKFGYTEGKDSCGATLLDVAKLCKQCGMENGINIDGGGSAQILVNNKRELKISDRKPIDNSEVERPVPVGLCVK